MDLERLNIEVRPRNHYQAVDLGMLIARRWYVPLFLLFALPVAVIFALSLVLFTDYPLVVGFVIWWLKPAFERLPLRYISRAIFADVPPFREAWRDWTAVVVPGIAGSLTFRRLSPRRSFDASVWVLERPSDALRGQRLRTLGGRAAGVATWLTVVGIHIEGFLMMGAITTIWIFVPQSEATDLLSFLGQTEPWQRWLNNAAYLLAACIFAPFYVAGGFSLYLNRRAELEAWDIEVGFRRLAGRLAALAMVVLLGFALSPVPVSAETDARTEASRQAVETILADEAFVSIETYRYPAFLDGWLDFDEAEKEEAMDLGAFFGGLAIIGEMLLWLSLAALIVWLLVRLKLLDWAGASTSPGRARAPTQLFGLSLSGDTLPEDVISSAREAWQQGDERVALSLLLRGVLLAMVDQYGCRFRAGDTEGDCLQEVRRSAPADTHQPFTDLVRQWQIVAYAHRAVSEEAFDSLCSAWQKHFDRTSGGTQT